jgi:hypothetical protein
MADFDQTANLQHTKVSQAAAKLRLDAATAEVLQAFLEGGVEAAILKGPSLAGWLYPADWQHYSDADILIRPTDEGRAAAVLAELGFELGLEDHAMPAWWREHGTDWVRPADAAAIDLHRRLLGVGIAPDIAWELLSADREVISLGGAGVPALRRQARLVHIALHAAQHGAKRGGKAILHVERAIAVTAEHQWQEAAVLAEELEALEPFAGGLQLARGGAEIAARMGLPAVRSVEVALRMTSPPPVALGFEQLARAPGVRARLAIVLRKLIPPRDFIVHWDPRAGESRPRLALAYLRRPLWLLGSAPKGLRAWREARRTVRRP